MKTHGQSLCASRVSSGAAPTASLPTATLSMAVLTLATLAIAALATGCATVEPWQRGRLAHDCMQMPVDDTEAAWFAHVQAVREGAIGPGDAAGGGCGCN